jgi:hypothetical protein
MQAGRCVVPPELSPPEPRHAGSDALDFALLGAINLDCRCPPGAGYRGGGGMRDRLALALAGVFSLAVSAQAAAPPRCYLGEEIEADQAIHFQTELMVLSDTCRASSYLDFLAKNRPSIISYQHAMMEYFRRAGERSGQAALDRYMTRLANETSLQYGDQAHDRLCADSAAFLATGSRIDGAELHRLIAARAADQRASYRRCVK